MFVRKPGVAADASVTHLSISEPEDLRSCQEWCHGSRRQAVVGHQPRFPPTARTPLAHGPMAIAVRQITTVAANNKKTGEEPLRNCSLFVSQAWLSPSHRPLPRNFPTQNRTIL